MSEHKVDIGADIATAVQYYVKALRHLDRKETSVLAIAEALNLPPTIVERAFSEFKISGGKLNPKRRVAQCAEMSSVVELKSRMATMAQVAA